MAFEEGTQELTCPECAAQHRLRWYRMPVRERMTIPCRSCGGILFAGNSTHEYYEVRLIDSS